MTELNRTEQDAVLGSEWKEVLCEHQIRMLKQTPLCKARA